MYTERGKNFNDILIGDDDCRNKIKEDFNQEVVYYEVNSYIYLEYFIRWYHPDNNTIKWNKGKDSK